MPEDEAFAGCGSRSESARAGATALLQVWRRTGNGERHAKDAPSARSMHTENKTRYG